MASLFRSFMAGLSERERRLVMLTGAVFVVLVVLMAVFMTRSAIGDLEFEHAERADLLRYLKAKEPEYRENQKDTAQSNSKGQSKPTPLRTLIDKIGVKLNVTVPDIKELPDLRHGDWLEHSVELSLQQIGLVNWTKFMEDVESNRTKFPIAITKIEVHKRQPASDEFDLTMVISTYERSVEPETKDKNKPGAGRKGGD